MKLLILGGTEFLGRYLVEAALARGHEVTLFNRGRTNADLFPAVEKLRGDRHTDLSALRGRRWDAVIDTSGYSSAVVRASAELLADAVEHYTFISSLSVYPDAMTPGQDEQAPVSTLPDEREDENNWETYGARKALCERTIEAILPGRTLSLRAGLIVGPHDYIDRFPWWVRRIAQGGEVLAPGRPAREIQLIDVRDLAEWNVRMAEARQAGVYNADGPDYPLTMEQVLTACKEASGSDARFTWVDDDFLLAHEVVPFVELPIWLPEATAAGFYAFDCRKAHAAGLTFRPLVETARATLDWDRARTPAEREPTRSRIATIGAHGLTPERERALLEAWHNR